MCWLHNTKCVCVNEGVTLSTIFYEMEKFFYSVHFYFSNIHIIHKFIQDHTLYHVKHKKLSDVLVCYSLPTCIWNWLKKILSYPRMMQTRIRCMLQTSPVHINFCVFSNWNSLLVQPPYLLACCTWNLRKRSISLLTEIIILRCAIRCLSSGYQKVRGCQT